LQAPNDPGCPHIKGQAGRPAAQIKTKILILIFSNKMTIDEANKIFKDWQEYQEINDKLGRFFMCGIPESFLPYPKDTLEEALNIVAKAYFDSGNRKISESIQETMATLIGYKNDEEVYDQITNNVVFKDIKLRKAVLDNLKKARDKWTNFKNKQ
jgi:hypothetical protein